jgi:hypothetical protein
MQSLHQSIIRILSSFWMYGLLEFNENIEKLTCRKNLKVYFKWGWNKSTFDTNTVVFHLDDFNYGRRITTIFFLAIATQLVFFITVFSLAIWKRLVTGCIRAGWCGQASQHPIGRRIPRHSSSISVEHTHTSANWLKQSRFSNFCWMQAAIPFLGLS